MFLVDSDVLIRAQRQYYAFDIAPCFWSQMKSSIATGDIGIIDRVSREALRGNDEFSNWIKNVVSDSVISTDFEVCVDNFSRIVNWIASESRYGQSGNNQGEFLDGADPWLVSYAIATNSVVVTLEKSAPQGSKIKIPDVCSEFYIETIDTFEMLRRLSICFS